MKTLLDRFTPVLCLAVLCLALAGCGTVSETGRKQLILISPGQEMQLGLTSFQQTKKQTPISRDPALNAMLQRVGKRIAAVATLPNAQWEFVLFESKEANAFCLPGGKVGVYTGILPVTLNEAGLAAVIGHEVAHATSHHGAERISEAMGIRFVGSILGQSLSHTDPRVQALSLAAYGIGTQVGRELPHSRAQESEADHVGLNYMARAGYDPAEAVKFWQRFSAHNQGGSSTAWFLRTHPLDEVRIKQLQGWLPEAQAQFRPQ